MQFAPPGAVRPKKSNPFQQNEAKRDLQRAYQEKQERIKLLPEAFQTALAQEAAAKKEFARIERFAKVEDDKEEAMENKRSVANRKPYYPSKEEMTKFKEIVAKEEADVKAAKKRLADAKKAEENKPKEVKREWNREFMYSDLIDKYKDYAGNVYHNPDFHLPPIITREKAIALVKEEKERQLLLQGSTATRFTTTGQQQQHKADEKEPQGQPQQQIKEAQGQQQPKEPQGQQKGFRFGLSNLLSIQDRLFMLGTAPNMATVAIEVADMHPRFWMSLPGSEASPAPNISTPLTGEEMRDLLNQQQHWPNNWNKMQNSYSRYGTKREIENPVFNVTCEQQQVSTQFQVDPWKMVYKVEFANMKAFKHYRKAISLEQFDALAYKPRLYHEQDSQIQMFTGMVDYTYYDWVEIPYAKFRVAEAREWQDYEALLDSYGQSRDDDMGSSAGEKAGNGVTSTDFRANGGRGGAKPQRQLREQQQQQRQHLRIWTKAHLEARVSIKHITALKDPKEKGAAVPVVLPLFDIETACWEQVEQQRKANLTGDLPAPIGDDEDKKDFEAGHYPTIALIAKKLADVKEGKHKSSKIDDLANAAHEQKKLASSSNKSSGSSSNKSGSSSSSKTKEQDKEKEAFAKTDLFPLATKPKDAVIVMATNFMVFGDKESYLKVLHCLGEPEFKASDLPNAVVFTFDKERDLLEHATSMFDKMHCQWIGGYNTIRYDLPYIYQRAIKLQSAVIRRNLSFFLEPQDDAYRRKQTSVRTRHLNSKMMKNVNMPQLETPGIFQFDLYPLVKGLVGNLETYTLKAVGAHYSKEDAAARSRNEIAKKDMPYQLISPYWAAGSHYYQRKLAIYCHFDVLVTEYVATRANLLAYAQEVARAAYTSVDQQMFQGQQIKIMNKMLKECRVQRRILDEQLRQEIQRYYDIDCQQLLKYQLAEIGDRDLVDMISFTEKTRLRKREKAYQGATVLDPWTGLYLKHVTTADFSSLYPSIMITFLLCFSTFIPAISWKGQLYFPSLDKIVKNAKGEIIDIQRRPDYVMWNPKDEKPSDQEVGDRILIMTAIDPTSGLNCCFVQNRGESLPCLRWRDELYFPTLDTITRDDKGQITAIVRGTNYVTWRPKEQLKPDAKTIAGRMLIMTTIAPSSGVDRCYIENRAGFLPGILKDLLAVRSKVKKEMEQAELAGDMFTYNVCDAKQAAIKVICNSAYGFTGAKAGLFGCIPIAITTCMIGRLKIMFTKHEFELLGADIIYGDTDSVFAIWAHLSNQKDKSFEDIEMEIRYLSTMACERVTKKLGGVMSLAFEKLMYPYLLIGKKQYVGLWRWPKPKFFCKGTPNVRRDSCVIARDTIKKTFEKVMDPKCKAEDYLQPVLKTLKVFEDPNMDLRHLVKTVSKRAEYSNDNLYQVKLFKKLEKRRGTPIDEGTRVPYVFALPHGGTRGRKNLKETVTDDAEDVQHMLQHNIRPNRSYYLERQIWKPLQRFLVETKLVDAKLLDEPITKVLGMIDRQDHRNMSLADWMTPRKPSA